MPSAYIEPFLSEDEEEYCPLCIEPMDLSDKHFQPCPCGYQVCQFCYNNIRENPELNGNCPACRRKYDDESVQYVILSPEELKLEQIKQAKKEKERKIRDKERKENENANRKQLANMRVIQKNLVYVVGLNPSVPYEEVSSLLKSDKYFGQYGRITKIVVNRKDSNNNNNQGYGVYVTFSKKDEAFRCITQVDGTYWDGRIIKAAYGTTKYCSSYLRGQACPNPNCMFLHEPGEEAEFFNKHGVHSTGRSGYNSTTHHSALPRTIPPLKASAPSNAADTEHVGVGESHNVMASTATNNMDLLNHGGGISGSSNHSNAYSSNGNIIASPNMANPYASLATSSLSSASSNSTASHYHSNTHMSPSHSSHHLNLNTSISSNSTPQLTPAGIPVSNPWGSVKPSTQPSVNPWLGRSSTPLNSSDMGSAGAVGPTSVGSAANTPKTSSAFPSFQEALSNSNSTNANNSANQTSFNSSISGVDASSNRNNSNGLSMNNNSSSLGLSNYDYTVGNNLNKSTNNINNNSSSNNSSTSISQIVGNQNLFTGLPIQQATVMKNTLKKNGLSSSINSINPTTTTTSSANTKEREKTKEDTHQINPHDPCDTAVKLLDDAIEYLSSFKNSSISLKTSIFRNENEQLRYQSMPPLFSFEDINTSPESDNVLQQKLVEMLSVKMPEANNEMNLNFLNGLNIPPTNASPENPMAASMSTMMYQSPHISPEQLVQQHFMQQQQFPQPPGMYGPQGQKLPPPMATQSVTMKTTTSNNSSDLLNQLIKGKRVPS